MALTEKQIRLASTIDQHVKQVIAGGGDDESLLLSMADYMDTFKGVMDSSTKDEMDELCDRFCGFYRYGKLLEAVAQGIENGMIRVA